MWCRPRKSHAFGIRVRVSREQVDSGTIGSLHFEKVRSPRLDGNTGSRPLGANHLPTPFEIGSHRFADAGSGRPIFQNRELHRHASDVWHRRGKLDEADVVGHDKALAEVGRKEIAVAAGSLVLEVDPSGDDAGMHELEINDGLLSRLDAYASASALVAHLLDAQRIVPDRNLSHDIDPVRECRPTELVTVGVNGGEAHWTGVIRTSHSSSDRSHETAIGLEKRRRRFRDVENGFVLRVGRVRKAAAARTLAIVRWPGCRARDVL